MMTDQVRGSAEERIYSLVIGGVILSAWAALAISSAAPELSHHHHTGGGHHASLPGPGGFMLGWVLMTLAMMLPGSVPWMNGLRRSFGNRPHPHRRVAYSVLGYVAVWTGFGWLAYLAHRALLAAVERVLPAIDEPDLMTAVLLLTAGVYQLTPIKRGSLARCRSPHTAPAADREELLPGLAALRCGVRHGLACVGSCWALMLLMFAAGGMSLGWMLALAAVMTAERTSRRGSQLAPAAGLLLVVWTALHH